MIKYYSEDFILNRLDYIVCNLRKYDPDYQKLNQEYQSVYALLKSSLTHDKINLLDNLLNLNNLMSGIEIINIYNDASNNSNH